MARFVRPVLGSTLDRGVFPTYRPTLPVEDGIGEVRGRRQDAEFGAPAVVRVATRIPRRRRLPKSADDRSSRLDAPRLARDGALHALGGPRRTRAASRDGRCRIESLLGEGRDERVLRSGHRYARCGSSHDFSRSGAVSQADRRGRRFAARAHRLHIVLGLARTSVRNLDVNPGVRPQPQASCASPATPHADGGVPPGITASVRARETRKPCWATGRRPAGRLSLRPLIKEQAGEYDASSPAAELASHDAAPDQERESRQRRILAPPLRRPGRHAQRSTADCGRPSSPYAVCGPCAELRGSALSRLKPAHQVSRRPRRVRA